MKKQKRPTRKAREIKAAKPKKKRRGAIELIKNSNAPVLPQIALDHPQAWELIAGMKIRDTVDFKKTDEKTVTAITKAQTISMDRKFTYSHVNNDYARIQLIKDGKRIYKRKK